MVIFVVWLFDTFSYLGGKIIGGIKLFPKISPGKTVSGLICGFIITLLISELFLITLNMRYNLSIFYTLVIIALAFIGDIAVSFLKRYAEVKDSGNIMPGHGGLLDSRPFILVFCY